LVDEESVCLIGNVVEEPLKEAIYSVWNEAFDEMEYRNSIRKVGGNLDFERESPKKAMRWQRPCDPKHKDCETVEEEYDSE